MLDLSFFRALQAKQWSLGSETTIDGLIAQVLQAFAEFEPRTIDCGFLTLQTCLNDMIEVNGGNDYKFDIWENKLCFVNLDIYRAAFRQLLKHWKSIKCLLGMDAKYTILGTTTLMLAPATAPSNR